MPETSLTALVQTLQQAALDACNNAVSLRENDKLASERKPDDKSVVTLADTTNEKMIRERLAAVAPQVQFLGEESNKDGSWQRWSQSGAGGKWFVVDPIDGTDNFDKKKGRWAVSIALQEDGISTAACVYVADDKHGRKGKLYKAIKGKGSYWHAVNEHGALEGAATRLRNYGAHNAQDGIQFIGSFPEDFPNGKYDGTWPQGTVYKAMAAEMQSQGKAPTLVTCACADMLSVAEGRAQAYVHGVHFPWDTAAAFLILAEAGFPLREFAHAHDAGKSAILLADTQAGLKQLEQRYRSAGATCLPTLNDQSVSRTTGQQAL